MWRLSVGQSLKSLMNVSNLLYLEVLAAVGKRDKHEILKKIYIV